VSGESLPSFLGSRPLRGTERACVLEPEAVCVVRCYHCRGVGGRQVIDGQQIRRWRTAAGLSLRELATAAKLSPAYLSDVELCRRIPPATGPAFKRLVQVLRRRCPCPPQPAIAG
jgi:hypothetical protein